MRDLSDEQLAKLLDKDIFHLISKAADGLGLECYVVGGYVRDLFLERPSNDIDVVVLAQQLLAQHVRIVFIHVKHHNTTRRNSGNLAAQFAADRAATARDQHRIARDIARSNARIQQNFVTAQQVSHVNIT